MAALSIDLSADKAIALLQSGKCTAAEFVAYTAAREARIKLEAAAAGQKALQCKVSQAGAVSVYNLQRMPVTLYSEQWERLLDFAPTIRAFVQDNAAALVLKSDDEATKIAKAKHPERLAAAKRSAESAAKRAAA